MYSLSPDPGGAARELERGRMVNPVTGLETAYEEVWRDEEAAVVSDPEGRAVACMVLRTEDAARERRGLVVRVGQYCQGLLREGDCIAAERWAWAPDARCWELRGATGISTIPRGFATGAERHREEGEEWRMDDQVWTVVESVTA